MGRLHPKREKTLRIKQPSYAFEFFAPPLLQHLANKKPKYKPWSVYPGMQRDFSLIMDTHITCESIIKTALKVGQPLAKEVRIFDRYESPQIGKDKMSIGIRIDFLQEHANLSEEQTTVVAQKICDQLIKTFNATLRTF